MVVKIVFLLSALHFIGKTIALHDFSNCDSPIILYADRSEYLRSPLWPRGYMPRSSCRYRIQAPIDYQIQVTCNVDMIDPSQDGSCSSERFYIGTDGNEDISNVYPICGRYKYFSRTANGNKLTIAYTSDYYSGRFDCRLTTICDCGWGLKSRIVGGTETLPNEFPSSAALIALKAKAMFCGATIVSSRFVVTAAHCLPGKLYNETGVSVGDHDFTTGTDTTEARLYLVSKFIEHPLYSDETDVNDIALVETDSPMVWSRGVGPVCLPFYYPGADFSGVDVTATGWGTTEFGGRLPTYLQKVDLTVLKNNDKLCRSTYENILSSQMCTYKQDKDTCQYDSGGPLYYSGPMGSRNFLIGQVSLGEGCGGYAPSLNTRLTSFMYWIESKTRTTLCRRSLY